VWEIDKNAVRLALNDVTFTSDVKMDTHTQNTALRAHKAAFFFLKKEGAE